MSRGAATGFDKSITVFSREGLLHQIEYAFSAVKVPGLTSVAVRGSDSVVVITQKKVPDKLLDPTSVTHLFQITKTIGVCITGLLADGKAVVEMARHMAAEFRYVNGYEIPVHLMAEKVADRGQLYTQHAFMRPYGISCMFVGMDEVDGAALYMADPAGHFCGYKACSSGSKEQEANNYLEKKVKDNNSMSYEETLDCAILALQTTLGSDLKPTDIEIGVCTKDVPEFTCFTEKEIDDHLTRIGERD